MRTLHRRVAELENGGSEVTHEDCLRALNAPNPDVAFAALRSRRSPAERERVARGLAAIEGGRE